MKIGDKVILTLDPPKSCYLAARTFRVKTEILGEPQEVFGVKRVLIKDGGLLDMSWIKKVEYLNTDGEEND